jgi:myosin heavy subunit
MASIARDSVLGTEERAWFLHDSRWELVAVLRRGDAGADLKTVRLGSGAEILVSRGDLYEPNTEKLTKASDLGMLDHLHEPGLLHVLRNRYLDGLYCTSIGDIVVAINPYSDQGDTTVNNMQQYIRRATEEVPPHAFLVADAAFRDMRDYGNDQAILICGESGSGKTETTKFVLRYLMQVSGVGPGAMDLAKKLMDSNPVLEAFGNAKTINNKNSSRFAKCMQLCFDADGRVLGATVQTAMLEKSRCLNQQHSEKNFHIFFQLCGFAAERDGNEVTRVLGADTQGAVLDASSYRYLRALACLPPRCFICT